MRAVKSEINSWSNKLAEPKKENRNRKQKTEDQKILRENKDFEGGLLVDLKLVLDGKPYTAHVEGRTVIINGKEYSIEEKKDIIVVDGTSYSVDIQGDKALINDIPHALKVESKAAAKTEKKGSAAPGAVIAMMPGKIVKVPVKEGDTVQEGDVVCILEAMKMENELHASKEGTIKKIHVTESANVEKGDILVEIE